MSQIIARPSQWAAIAAILKERKYQDEKYGDCPHELAGWLLVIRKELREAEESATGHGFEKNRTGRNSVRAEIVQIAAVCVAALEQHGVEEQ